MREDGPGPCERAAAPMRRRLALAFLAIACLTLAYGVARATSDPPLREVAASFANGDVTLSGTLVLPPSEGPHPGVVVLHGSGPETRLPYLPDATMLARNGVAALIYDKRGTGLSEGELAPASLEDLQRDAQAAVDWLRDQPGVDPRSVGVLGVSQGGWLAPFVAAAHPALAFLVQVTASATPLAVQESWRTGHRLERLGYDERDIVAAMRAHRLFFSTRPLLRAGLLPVEGIWFTTFDPWRDPRQAWSRVDVPALVLLAGDDRSVPSRLSREVLSGLQEPSAAAAPHVIVLGGVGHALGGPRRNDDPVYVDLVTGWILAVAEGDPSTAVRPPAGEPLPSDPNWFSAVAAGRSWHANAGIHLPLLLAIVVVSLLGAVRSIGGRRQGARSRGAAAVRVGFRLLSVAAHLVVVVGVVLAIFHLLDADAASLPPPVPLAPVTAGAAWIALVTAVGHLASALRAARGDRSVVPGAPWLALAGFAAFLVAAYWGSIPGPT